MPPGPSWVIWIVSPHPPECNSNPGNCGALWVCLSPREATVNSQG